MKDLTRIVNQEGYEYSDPLTLFIKALNIDFDFEEALVELLPGQALAPPSDPAERAWARERRRRLRRRCLRRAAREGRAAGVVAAALGTLDAVVLGIPAHPGSSCSGW